MRLPTITQDIEDYQAIPATHLQLDLEECFVQLTRTLKAIARPAWKTNRAIAIPNTSHKVGEINVIIPTSKPKSNSHLCVLFGNYPIYSAW